MGKGRERARAEGCFGGDGSLSLCALGGCLVFLEDAAAAAAAAEEEEEEEEAVEAGISDPWRDHRNCVQKTHQSSVYFLMLS